VKTEVIAQILFPLDLILLLYSKVYKSLPNRTKYMNLPVKYSKIAGILAVICTLLSPVLSTILWLLQPLLDGSQWFPIPGLYGEFEMVIYGSVAFFSYPIFLIAFPLFILGFKEIFVKLKDKIFSKIPMIVIILFLLQLCYTLIQFTILQQVSETEIIHILGIPLGTLHTFVIFSMTLNLLFAIAMIIFGMGLRKMDKLKHAKTMGTLLIISYIIIGMNTILMFLMSTETMNSPPFYPPSENMLKIFGGINIVVTYIYLLIAYAYILGVRLLSEKKK